MNAIDLRIVESDRIAAGQVAEGLGLRAAKIFPKPYRAYQDPDKQQRFERGFRDGKAMMEVDHAGAHCAGRPEVALSGRGGGESDDHDVRTPAARQPSPYSGA